MMQIVIIKTFLSVSPNVSTSCFFQIFVALLASSHYNKLSENTGWDDEHTAEESRTDDMSY